MLVAIFPILVLFPFLVSLFSNSLDDFVVFVEVTNSQNFSIRTRWHKSRPNELFFFREEDSQWYRISSTYNDN